MSLFINTRPSDRAEPLTKLLQVSGFRVMEMPLLEMIPLALTDSQKQQIAKLLAGEYALLIVVSRAAAETGCQSLLSTPIDNNTQVVAVGKATAEKLNEYGITAIIPKVSNNEGMLALDCISNLDTNSRVMIWRGQGGRRLLIDELRSRGVTVDIIELYQRHLPQSTVIHFGTLMDALIDTTSTISASKNQDMGKCAKVLISSGESFHNWEKLLMTNEVIPSLDAFEYLVLGNRLTSMLREKHLSYQKIESLTPQNILDALKSYQIRP